MAISSAALVYRQDMQKVAVLLARRALTRPPEINYGIVVRNSNHSLFTNPELVSLSLVNSGTSILNTSANLMTS